MEHIVMEHRKHRLHTVYVTGEKPNVFDSYFDALKAIKELAKHGIMAELVSERSDYTRVRVKGWEELKP